MPQFLAHLILRIQMCYCCRKLENCHFHWKSDSLCWKSASLAPWTLWQICPDWLSQYCDVSNPVREHSLSRTRPLLYRSDSIDQPLSHSGRGRSSERGQLIIGYRFLCTDLSIDWILVIDLAKLIDRSDVPQILDFLFLVWSCFQILGGHMSVLGPLVPLFWISDDVSSGF